LTPDQQRGVLQAFTDMRAAAEEAGDVELHPNRHSTAVQPNK
jgi:hypothetical protein